MAITSKGLQKLGFVSGTDFVLEDDGSGVQMTWLSGATEPTVSAIETAHTEWEAEAYARTRAAAYPSVADFMEAYTEKEIGSDSTKWDAYVIAYNKVRTDNPKP